MFVDILFKCSTAYENQTVFYKYFLTHSDYDQEKWKNDPNF
ncbi:type II toxin-antitoxin system HigB family toxin [Microcoleus sp. Z1_B5]